MSIDIFNQAMSYLPAALHKMGYQTLRPGQDRVVLNLFAGKSVFCILPTGQGKSACYIIPTICLNYRTLIFSPLISLMQDQVEALWRLGLKAGQISSGQSDAENQAVITQWMSGQLQFLLVAPERIDNAQFRLAIGHVRPDMVVIDEAHCCSQWADSFRPHYARLGEFCKLARPKSLLLLTATATDDVEQDVRRILCAEAAERVIYYPKRRNLLLTSRPYTGDPELLQFVNNIDGSVIVYCSTVKRTEEMYGALGHHCKGRALIYNGSMTPDARTTNQTMFMRDEVKVMFATKAFGLGINKPNIRGVVHRDISGSVDDLAQEMGRAGRDGLESQCRLFFDPKTYDTQQFFIKTSYPEERMVRAMFSAIKRNLDADGICKVTIGDLTQQAGMYSAFGDGCMGVLAGAGVIDRNFDAGKIATIRLRKPHADEEYKAVQDGAELIGTRKGEAIEFDLDALGEKLKLKDKKLKDILKSLDKEGYINYIAPYRGKPTRIVGDIDKVDFRRLKGRYESGMAKLSRVIDYHDCPDRDKHTFLQEYFGVKVDEQ